MNLQKEFAAHWQQRRFTTSGQKVLLAVSGGMDSMALAQLLADTGIPFAIAHCNFRLRAEASDLDAALVSNWAAKHNIALHSIAFDTQQEMLLRGKGVQETARELRYHWFRELSIENGYAAIVTAHHANDNAETLLINLSKGTGIAGLHAIPETNGQVIRPLLFATRKEIEQYVQQYNIPYREDASNSSTKYLRNAIRHKVLPVLEELLPGVTERFSDNIRRFSEAEQLYRKAVAAERKKLMEQRGQDFYIPILKLKKAVPLETICFELLAPFGFTPAQSLQIVQLLDSESGHFISSATHRVIRDRMFLVITAAATGQSDLILIDQLPVTITTGDGQRFRLKIQECPEKISMDKDTATLDITGIELPLQLRRKRSGDYFYPMGMGMKKKKLSRFLIDQKVALHEKEQLWLLAHNNHILWVCGHRIDERFKVSHKTKQVLLIEKTDSNT